MAESSGKARVSIGMPVYNRESYVSEAIEAHLRQTYSDFELIITDNHSTDQTEDVWQHRVVSEVHARALQGFGPFEVPRPREVGGEARGSLLCALDDQRTFVG